jgi:hypothetical protein
LIRASRGRIRSSNRWLNASGKKERRKRSIGPRRKRLFNNRSLRLTWLSIRLRNRWTLTYPTIMMLLKDSSRSSLKLRKIVNIKMKRLRNLRIRCRHLKYRLIRLK